MLTIQLLEILEGNKTFFFFTHFSLKLFLKQNFIFKKTVKKLLHTFQRTSKSKY